MKRWRNHLRFALGVVVTLPVVYYLLVSLDLAAFFRLLAGADIFYLAIGLVCLYLSTISLEAWRIFLAIRNDGLTFRASNQMVVVGVLAANIVGSLVVADAWRMHKIAQLGGNLGSKLSRFAAVKLIGTAATFLTFALWLPFAPEFFQAMSQSGTAMDFGRLGGWPVVSAIAALVIALIAAIAIAPLRKRAARLYAAFVAGLRELSAAAWLAIGGISVAMNVLRAISVSYFIYALGGDIPLLFPIGLVALVTLGSIVPLTPANIGVREFIFVAILTFFHQSPELALAVALLNRVGLILFGLSGIPALLTDRAFLVRDRAKPNEPGS